LCFDKGFLARKANFRQKLKDDQEYKAGVSFKAHPDGSFVIKTATSLASNPTLLNNKDIPKTDVKKKSMCCSKAAWCSRVFDTVLLHHAYRTLAQLEGKTV